MSLLPPSLCVSVLRSVISVVHESLFENVLSTSMPRSVRKLLCISLDFQQVAAPKSVKRRRNGPGPER